MNLLSDFRTAWRNLRRNGFYSFINIAGLAVSLAACTFILLWVQDEKSYDRFHQDAENIYTVKAHFKTDGKIFTTDISSGLFAPVAEQNFSEVTSYCRTRDWAAGYLQAGDIKTGEKRILFSDSTFFTFFNFPVVKGEQQGLLQNADDVIISESLAKELFGSKDPIGQMIDLERFENLQVVAVMKDIPDNTTIPRADAVCSHKVDMNSIYGQWLNTWTGCELLVYLRLKPGTDTKQLAEQVTAKQSEQQDRRSFTLQPLVNMHLYTADGEEAGIKTVRMFQWIALIILCIACVNYINLVTARSSKRHREIGLKKILGARKPQLFLQLIIEAVFLFTIAAVIAILLNTLLLPAYGQLSGKEITMNWLSSGIWLIYGLMFLFVSIIAGIYPAWMLALFNPANMQGMQQKRRNTFFRRTLVVLQFVSSAVLIVGTITLGEQMKYIREKNLGFDKEHVLICSLYNAAEHFDVVKTTLMQHATIVDVTAGSENIMEVSSGTGFENWEGKTGDGVVSLNQERVDTSFLRVMQIPLIEGQGFTSTSEMQFILNEAAIHAMGMEEPIGKWAMRADFKIVGVVKDFHFQNLHQEIRPMVMYYQAPRVRWKLYVRTTGDAKQAVAEVEKIWNLYNPDYTFDYTFLDDTFDHEYRSDVRTGRLFGIFSVIAVLISCLGLLGLVTFTAETKYKEIGIRKVLGASVADIVNMLSKEFLVLVGIAMLVAFPLAYYWFNNMLEDYAYRISLAWWMFAIAAVITICLTMLTVGFQAIKAATTNPVKSIKAE